MSLHELILLPLEDWDNAVTAVVTHADMLTAGVLKLLFALVISDG